MLINLVIKISSKRLGSCTILKIKKNYIFSLTTHDCTFKLPQVWLYKFAVNANKMF